MVRSTGKIAAAALVCGCAVAAASTGAKSGACHPRGSRTLAASSQARVYSVAKTVYGCAFSTGESWQLGTTGFCNGAKHIEVVRVKGTLAGYGYLTCGVDTGNAFVVVQQLTDGTQLVNEPATEMPTGPESYNHVESLVLKADGAVAWIGTGKSIVADHLGTIEVRRVQGGVETLLDSGKGIHPHSLRLDGSALTWKHGKQTRTATLS